MTDQLTFEDMTPAEANDSPLILEDMGTTGLVNFVATGGPQMYYDRLRVAARVIAKRYSNTKSIECFYRAVEKFTPADTLETLKRWTEEKLFAGALVDGWKSDKETAQRWAVEIRESWKNRQPCPFIPTNWRGEIILDLALHYAGMTDAVFIPAPPVEERRGAQ